MNLQIVLFDAQIKATIATASKLFLETENGHLDVVGQIMCAIAKFEIIGDFATVAANPVGH